MSTELTTPTFPAVVFSVTDAAISALEAKHKGLVIAHGDKKGYLALTQAIAEVRTARTDVEKRRKELKQDALDYGRLVDSTAKAITDPDMITIDRVELITRAELMRRNTRHNLPEEIKELVILKYRITRAINRRFKHEK